jgi:hypothetical protein
MEENSFLLTAHAGDTVLCIPFFPHCIFRCYILVRLIPLPEKYFQCAVFSLAVGAIF